MKARFGALLGCDPSYMTYDVTNVAKISDSVTASILKVVSASAMSRGDKVSPPRKFTLDPRKPDIPKLNEIKAHSISFAIPDSILCCCASDRKVSFIRKPTSLRIAQHPFAKGAERLAYYGASIFRSKGSHDEEALLHEDEVVFKERILLPTNHKLDVARYFVDLETQSVASKLAMEFSCVTESMGIPFKLKFLKATLVRIESAIAGGHARYLSMEKLYKGDAVMLKYTSNHKFVNTINPSDPKWSQKIEFLLAFSHFTYEKSVGYLVVCDLQGISGAGIESNDIILTDPAIHCEKAPRFGTTNLGKAGIDTFTKNHVCTPVCAKLGLRLLSRR